MVRALVAFLLAVLGGVGNLWDPNGDVGSRWDPNGSPTTDVGGLWDPDG